MSNINSVNVGGMVITKEDLLRFAPIVTVYDSEQFTPCPIEALLQNSQWYRVPLDQNRREIWSDAGKNITPNEPTPDALARLSNNGHDVKIQLHPSVLKGIGWNNAPMYVCPQVPADKSFVDLSYIFLFAYNGPQSVELELPLLKARCVAPEYATHQGDIEGVTVRVDRSLQRVLSVRFEAHGTPTWYPSPQVRFDPSGSRPYVGCALNSHATYNILGRSGKYSIKLADLGLAEYLVTICDFVQTDGATWNITDAAKLIFVGIDNDKPLWDQNWVGFAGRLGSYGVNQPKDVYAADGPLNFLQAQAANAVSKAAYHAGVIPSDDLVSLGPVGLFNRGNLKITTPLTN